MAVRQFSYAALASALAFICLCGEGKASEYAFSTYGLGESAFGAGVTPPPGTYVTAVAGFYSGDIGSSATFGGVTINAGASVEGFTSGLNVLYVPERKLFDGSIGLAMTIPFGHLNGDATIGVAGGRSVSAETEGWGFGDVTTRAQLGWKEGDFSHLIYVQVVAPTGRWQPGFSPIIGLHRPGIDTGWAFTWEHKPSKLQFNGAAGVTFNLRTQRPTTRPATNFTSNGQSAARSPPDLCWESSAMTIGRLLGIRAQGRPLVRSRAELMPLAQA